MKFSVIQQQKLWWTISGVMILSGLIAMFISWQQLGAPLRPGLDFTGGTRLQFELNCTQPGNCAKPIDLAQVRSTLAELNLADSSIQLLGTEQQALSIRTKPLNVDQRTKLQTLLSQKVGAFAAEKTQIDTVGPTVGRELFTSGLLSLFVAFAGIGGYLSLRFRSDYALFAIIALFHDIMITLGIFSILGLVLGTEVDSLFVVALLTIAGFSVTDTVVIYDRIRENINLHPTMPIDELVDESVRQSLTRSLNTVFTVLLTLFSLFVFGGETLKNFALALIVGFGMGAYSSIFIASPLLAWWRSRAKAKHSYSL
ncbi:protein translocase subunit SecF [Iningainema tapete]|uniref:Protein-export membrane protein SecF n=1 Tax=Iningainema tapete BLCC-T55 TaxID=2748662 RepID=A0A8J7C0A5_9CYAN|nr:protein translocase subunit SecF [Iningainema tapete]MBD2777678.1 protein translocase subunit SecF [Iningainema tapete BLCC-T55]